MTKRSYAAGSFELTLDGHVSTAYLKSVEGGQIKGAKVDEAVGPTSHRIKHLSTMEIEPLSLDMGMSGTEPILKWIQGSWRHDYGRRNGQISHADFNLSEQFVVEFYDALIAETTFPALDGGSKDPAYLKMKIQPEHVVWKKGASSEKLKASSGSKQKMWIANSFRLTIDGIDAMEYTNKIEAFTIKQSITKMFTGEDRFPQLEPANLTFPDITGTIAVEYADGLLKWSKEYLHHGQADSRAQKSGSLEFLAPDKKQTLFRINLYDVGVSALQLPSNTANESQIKRVKYTLYVGRMDLDGRGALGME